MKKLTEIAQTAPDTVILAKDEASLYLQATLCAVGAAKGQTPVIKVAANRQLPHFYGTLNLLTGEAVAQHGPVLNATVTAEHLEWLLTKFPDVPLLLFWDRAPWHHGPAITQVLAANPRRQTISFPTAAPALNPQEHVWKTVQAAISHNHDEQKLDPLVERFEHHLNHITCNYSFVEKYDFESLSARFK